MTPRSDSGAVRNAATPRHETSYATPSDRDLVITRTFDAPRALVWATFTEAKHVPHWQTGPEGFTMPVCEIDLRTGGTWRYVWRNASGREFEARGTYRDVDPPNCFTTVTDRGGVEQTSVTSFADDDGRTTVTVTLHLADAASRDQALQYSKMGTSSSYTRLDAYLASQP